MKALFVISMVLALGCKTAAAQGTPLTSAQALEKALGCAFPLAESVYEQVTGTQIPKYFSKNIQLGMSVERDTKAVELRQDSSGKLLMSLWMKSRNLYFGGAPNDWGISFRDIEGNSFSTNRIGGVEVVKEDSTVYDHLGRIVLKGEITYRFQRIQKPIYQVETYNLVTGKPSPALKVNPNRFQICLVKP